MAFSFVTAFLALMICSKSSFLYPMNDWVDVNCFFTLGRAIKHGKVPYLDLYEQKGPVLYFLFFLAALISETGFLGVFIIEALSFAWFLYESGRTAALWTGEKDTLLPFLPLIAACVCVSKAFTHGTSAEQLFLPVLASALRIVLAQMKKGAPFTWKQLLVLGLYAGAALWFKYTFCGFFLGLFLAVLVWYLTNRYLRQLLPAILCAALGAAALSGLIAGWFALRGGLSALIEAYFTVTVNGSGRTLMCRSTYSNDTFSTVTLDLPLQAGENTLTLSNDGSVRFADQTPVSPLLQWIDLNPVSK